MQTVELKTETVKISIYSLSLVSQAICGTFEITLQLSGIV